MQKDAEGILPKILEEAHDLESNPRIPDLTRIRQSNCPTTMLGGGLQESAKIWIAANDPVKSHDVGFGEILCHICKIGMYKIDTFGMTASDSFIPCNFQVGR